MNNLASPQNEITIESDALSAPTMVPKLEDEDESNQINMP